MVPLELEVFARGMSSSEELMAMICSESEVTEFASNSRGRFLFPLK